jgi:hypothetical protein
MCHHAKRPLFDVERVIPAGILLRLQRTHTWTPRRSLAQPAVAPDNRPQFVILRDRVGL